MGCCGVLFTPPGIVCRKEDENGELRDAGLGDDGPITGTVPAGQVVG